MSLDHQRCYEALRSRDTRFDGRFWVGVRTTGVYCRPVCPSRTPLSRNVDFYAHPAAAEDAGLRPCRRCRPEAAPGSSGWKGSAGVVDRAVRLIDEGALDEGGVSALARRLHVGDRHLRRLFVEHLGTTPDAVARSRRAHLARRLLADTDLRVADIAFAAGFGSVRQCNDVLKATFRATPTELRADLRPARGAPSRTGSAGVAPPRAGSAGVAPSGALTLRLAVRPPFDGAALLDWFAARAVAGLEVVDADRYTRRVAVGDRTGAVTIRPAGDAVVLDVDLPPDTHLGSLVAGARRAFDLGADPVAVDEHLGADPLLGRLVARRPGIRVPGSWGGFEAGVRAVIGQQISVAAARTVLGRIVAAHGRDGAFPEPEDLAAAPLEQLGIIGQRADTIRRLADAVLAGAVVLDGSVPHEGLVASLVALKGIGPWSAEYVALRLGEPDAFPAGDLHLRRMLDATNDRTAIARAEAWRPWRAYAAMHLWQTPREERP
ncbi:helix-turn-helix domain-containing protein [Acidimicrobiia bacterium EGI L10123]|uniref:AlkA N-terminal domain-containing protein n=1 Tax=Salinilacustrithrix flava TaxID=2957203 RepID=UPI003D7C27D3|nr:helix-turn-helix domain-containing protein [Acidimicrobiia bacterium EGI L10123]